MTEQEAINDDVDLGDPISRAEFWAYMVVGLLALISPLVVGYLLVAYFFRV